MPDLLRLAKEKIPLFAMAALSSVITLVTQQHGGAVKGLESVPLLVRLANVPVAYLAYIGKMLWPAELAALYPVAASAPVLKALAGALLLTGVTIFAVSEGRRHGYFLVGWLWFVGTLIPVIGLVQVGNQSMADRYSYVPLIGLFLIVAWGVPELAANWRYGKFAIPAAAVCILAACGAASRAQLQYWTGDIALWERALDVTEDNPVLETNLGGTLLRQGKAADAIPHFEEALRIKPGVTETQADLGMALMSEGHFDQAAQQFHEALRSQPDFTYAHYGLGEILLFQKKFDEAERHFVQALRAKPDFAEAHYGLGQTLLSENRPDEAIHQFAEALRIKPGYAEAQAGLKEAQEQQAKAAQ